MDILGIMSGSSLDGVDLALCRFETSSNKTSWEILKSATYQFDDNWKQRLANLPVSSARELALADFEFGYYLGRKAKEFSQGMNVDYIASHGHTIFHEPQNKMTFQIGNGAAIAISSGISAISDFRSSDIASGGQGAPLVSIIDRDLFPDYDALINLGGIANISFTKLGKVIAYDICPCNQLLNYLASKVGLEYDKGGILASGGKTDSDLLKKLREFDFFGLTPPKSLDNNAIRSFFFPVLDTNDLSLEHKMATAVELIASTLTDEMQSKMSTNSVEKKVLLTGGGAKNEFLVQKIKEKNKNMCIIVPDNTLIDFKEALLMAYVGFLRITGKSNVISSVTGASKDCISGALYIN